VGLQHAWTKQEIHTKIMVRKYDRKMI